jgi:hypothetical protein
MAVCGADTSNGRQCRRLVKSAGDRCFQHRPGLSPPAQAPVLVPLRRIQERERVAEAAALCADLLSYKWQAAVAGRIADYARPALERLSRHRRRRNCKALARIARSILETEPPNSRLSGWVADVLGASDAALAFAEQLASAFPLPPAVKMVAVARGAQVTGVLLCAMDGRDLADCECFVDLALTQPKEQVREMLVGATSDWTGLKTFAPSLS